MVVPQHLCVGHGGDTAFMVVIASIIYAIYIMPGPILGVLYINLVYIVTL